MTRGSRLYALLFNAITRAIPADRFLSLSDRQAVTDAVAEVIEGEGSAALDAKDARIAELEAALAAAHQEIANTAAERNGYVAELASQLRQQQRVRLAWQSAR